MILVDRQRLQFPAAKLILRDRGDSLHALLYSDDPPEALTEAYRGNSFYIEMVLEASPEMQNVTTSRWVYKAPTSDRSDTVSGIYLDGQRQHLQPFDVVVEMEHQGSPARVWVSGDFLLYDAAAAPNMPGQMIPVMAELDADLTVRPR